MYFEVSTFSSLGGRWESPQVNITERSRKHKDQNVQ